MRLTGKKWFDREYLSYTGYPGGQRVATPEIMMKKSFNKHLKPGYHPLFIKVVKGMLPKNRLGRRIIENMHVYNGSEHPHAAQNPKVIDINKIKSVSYTHLDVYKRQSGDRLQARCSICCRSKRIWQFLDFQD